MEHARSKPAEGTGWVTFASVLFLILGAFNLIDGIAALSGYSKFIEEHLSVGSLEVWGTFFICLGAIQLFAGYMIWQRRVLGQVIGIFLVAINLVAQLIFLPAYPVWSIVIMVVDCMLFYALTVYGELFH
jgi:uncharacterized membrane protein